jgi:hypothetical protein
MLEAFAATKLSTGADEADFTHDLTSGKQNKDQVHQQTELRPHVF